ncbi:Galactarate dehydratase (L-threo-forming) [Paraburkholderia graminis C4D1M]|uniref:Galactarate dehydratase n=1 Tax=Paraburkholderia graminis (strain ATCC 700544 / DSM 17151 / LMG 18924 / NCIMB 13744 / C4D1M) TaxID=396598 RepID=B1G6I9_PARG4|nr:altronate dehydratase family protein [Paraburkholderia graminis]EDT08236.1 Galactarate dehydratase [Paraburkholderia graminis C4D1M]CAB3723528.1 Galactarate dehydratase (L-threo-forming) [Paraburkholderia graminis C4D1M]
MIELSSKTVSGPVIRLHPADNVVIARIDVAIGTPVPSEDFCSRSQVPAGYKVAARSLRRGEPIRKYNVVIGFAATDIAAGTIVHGHNVEFRDFDRDYAFGADFRAVDFVPAAERATFQGIVRSNGQVGTRNYIGVLSTVNCSATVAHRIAEWFTAERLADYPNVDGVVAFTHSTGCGMEMSGEPMALLRRTMAGYARHPNLAAALIVGLGCERNQLQGLLDQEDMAPGPRLHTFTMQQSGGTRKTIEDGIEAVKALLPEANRVTRTTVDASHLKVGLQCGGSDGFSSITANPSLGAAMDLLVRHGGTAILSETPEIYGVEHTLTRRAASREVGEKLIERIRWWKDEYSVNRDVQINGRVSPGNQVGGLANIFEKSIGSSMKGGTGPLMEVYRYAEPVTAHGLVFMDTPGFDPVSATGQIAGGANLIAFTTGRGSMFGAKPVPSLKLATNTPMYRRLTEDMDLNCGGILDGVASIESMGREIFDALLKVASGERTKSELLGLGDHEFVPWQIGIMS